MKPLPDGGSACFTIRNKGDFMKGGYLLRLLVVLPLVAGGFWHAHPLPQRVQSQETYAASIPIQHIVFLLKENRTFDNYFGLFPGVNGASTGKVKVNGVVQTIPLGPFQDASSVDYSHKWVDAHAAYDSGAMDHFNVSGCAQAPYPCYQVAQQSDIPNYWSYAQNYLLNDNTFSDLEGPSMPNHMYSVAGASGA